MVAADTTRAYAEACSAGYQLKVAQQSVDLQQKFVKLTAERVQRGRGIAIDNSRATSPARAAARQSAAAEGAPAAPPCTAWPC
jgi:outer membrane protein TolC